MYAKLANLHSLPATLRRAEAPETYASAAGQHKCHWSKRFQAHAFAAERIHASPRRSRPNARPKAGLWTRDKPARRARSAAAVSLLLAGTVSVSLQHTLPAGGLRRRRERIGPSGRDEIFRPTYFPVSKLTAQYAQILQSRAAKQICPRRTT